MGGRMVLKVAMRLPRKQEGLQDRSKLSRLVVAESR